MEHITVEQDKMRLDQVVYHYYGDLSMFDAVLAANLHLESVILERDEQIALPPKVVVKQEDKLW